MNAPAATGPSPPKHVRHVGWLLFAPALCRKLAKEATFSWHLPRRKKQEPAPDTTKCRLAGVHRYNNTHAKTSPVIPERLRNDGEEEEEEEKSSVMLFAPRGLDRMNARACKAQRRAGRGLASLMEPAKP